MNLKSILSTLAGAAACVHLAGAEVPGAPADVVKTADAKVGRAMQGYNAKNSKAFYKDWAQQMKAIQTDQAFNSLYVNMYHKDYGTYQSGTIDESRSTFADMNGLLVYKAKFSKKPGTLSVNFFKEGGDYKIQQIQVGP
jgi:hypothetical protein